MSAQPVGEQPVLDVVKGDPTPEELVAILAVLAGRGNSPAATAPTPTSGWSAYWRTIKAPLVAGPGAWRSSGYPCC